MIRFLLTPISDGIVIFSTATLTESIPVDASPCSLRCLAGIPSACKARRIYAIAKARRVRKSLDKKHILTCALTVFHRTFSGTLWRKRLQWQLFLSNSCATATYVSAGQRSLPSRHRAPHRVVFPHQKLKLKTFLVMFCRASLTP